MSVTFPTKTILESISNTKSAVNDIITDINSNKKRKYEVISNLADFASAGEESIEQLSGQVAQLTAELNSGKISSNQFTSQIAELTSQLQQRSVELQASEKSLLQNIKDFNDTLTRIYTELLEISQDEISVDEPEAAAFIKAIRSAAVKNSILQKYSKLNEQEKESLRIQLQDDLNSLRFRNDSISNMARDIVILKLSLLEPTF